mgnify:CR=1 FL=1
MKLSWLLISISSLAAIDHNGCALFNRITGVQDEVKHGDGSHASFLWIAELQINYGFNR